jgi:hypothetical protein
VVTLLVSSVEGILELNVDLRIVQQALGMSRLLNFPYHQDRSQQMDAPVVECTDKSLLPAANLRGRCTENLGKFLGL